MIRDTATHGEDSDGMFESLPARLTVGPPRDPALTIPEHALILGAARPVRNWLESGWLGHIPLMFGLFELHRPRRFVELGSHHGASFFAACQAVAEGDLDCQCVAVDHWRGDPQAGFFADTVFEGFQKILNENYRDFATFVRDDFDGAAGRFEDASIDLLHIDGFHSYDAVRHDFETWRPKLSAQGVIIFHDVNEHQADFGVWRFWREIEREYKGRTLFFGQSHGLGLLSLDNDGSTPIAALIASCRDEGRMAFLQQYLTSIAHMNTRYHDLLSESNKRSERELYEAHVAREEEVAGAHERFETQLADTIHGLEENWRHEADRYELRITEGSAAVERLRQELREQGSDYRIRIGELLEQHESELADYGAALAAAEAQIRASHVQHLEELAQVRRDYEGSRSWRASRVLRLPSDIRRSRRSPQVPTVADDLRKYFRLHWYLNQAALAPGLDVEEAIAHYMSTGRARGLSPHPLFDPSWYGEQLPEQERDQEDLFLHYLHSGQVAGLEPHPCFNPARYLEVAHLEKATARPFEHYLTDQTAWRLSPHELFDGAYYLDENADVAAAGVNPLVHYLESGERERRRPNPDFEPDWYRSQYSDHIPMTYSALADFAARRSTRGTQKSKLARRDAAVERLNAFLSSTRRPSLSTNDAPLVTVAIAVWNQAHFTLACLESLVDCAIPLRVVVVDNHSTDRTGELLERWDGVEVIRNAENRGFLEATNQALQLADTPYVLLLNNDATVRPGSIERAVSILDETRAGAVAAKVVLPNGLLQEAGSYLWADASAQGYLRGEPWQTGASMHRRQVDFGSGAFLMMRTAPVRDLGGLDPLYMPAYYEEVDLCMRLARAGWPTIYDPSVIIDHVEFGSTPDQRDAIQLQIDHRHLVAERFDDELRDRPSAGTVHPDVMANWATHARRGVLLVDDRLPVGSEGSGLPRAEVLTTALARDHRLHVFLAPMIESPGISWSEVRGVLDDGVEVYPELGERGMDRILTRLKGRFDTLVVSRFHNLVKIENLRKSQPALFDGVRLVYDSEAVGVKRERLQASLLGRPWSSERYRAMLENEMDAARAADSVLAVSESDADVFRDAGCPDVRLVTHAVEIRRSAPGPATRKGLLFVGRLNEPDSPNVDSVTWFLDNCLEELRARFGVGITVVGKTSRRVMAGLRRPGVAARGTVADLNPVFDSARVFVAPTRYAAGTPIKVLTAAAAGIPVVCTSLLCEQLGWIAGDEVQVADSPDEFVERVGLLLTDDDMWQRQREAAFGRLDREYSMESFIRSVSSALAEGSDAFSAGRRASGPRS